MFTTLLPVFAPLKSGMSSYATPSRAKPPRALPSVGSSYSSSRNSVSTEDWSSRRPVSTSRFLSGLATPQRKISSTSTTDFLNQHMERERDQYKDQARIAERQLAKVHEILKYDVGEPRLLGIGSRRTPVLSDDLIAKVTNIQEGYYCAKEELEALAQEFAKLETRGQTENVEMIHKQLSASDLKSAQDALSKFHSELSCADSAYDDEGDFDLSDREPSPEDLEGFVLWQSRKIAHLKEQRDVARRRLEMEKAEVEQFKDDMLLSVRVAERFRREAELEAKALREQLEKLAKKTEQLKTEGLMNGRPKSNDISKAPIKAKEGTLPIWDVLKQKKPLGSRRNAFLEWCRDRLQPYEIEIQNFSSHWNDGRAFCGLLHSFNSSYMNPRQMSKSTARGNVEYVLKVAERLKIPEEYRLSAGRLCREKPNWQDVMEFTAQLASALLRAQPEGTH
ncbi:hypothetical protein L596_023525 [Steinernema carpocapsae]|uniref:Calponin-homology (CH) domain-containing protein n=1 Tax=Steinernema carpocapsae TaxID=34508 RepID=A0A4U5ME51_STECR|nr:hypothetical protein L596_023525 [Steinernema carpocapsae]